MHDNSNHSEAFNRQQTDLLFGLIHVGPDLLQQFIDGARRELGELRTMCREAAESGRYGDMIEPAFRLVHGVKGNAALFDLTAYRDYTDDLENELQGARRRKTPASREWIDRIMKKVDVMDAALNDTETVLAELAEWQHTPESEISVTRRFLINLQLLVEELAGSLDKHAHLYCTNFDLDHLPDAVYHDVVEIVTQLVRNALAHGIEGPDGRKQLGKPPGGRIFLQTGWRDDHWFVRVQDDGRGPDFEKLQRIVSRRSAGVRDRCQLAKVMFSPGVSTTDAFGDAAGRGAGMDVIVQRVRRLGGSLELRFAVGQGCRFDVLLPKARILHPTGR